MIFVAAAGNYGSNNDIAKLQPTFPASYDDPNIISVGFDDSDFKCLGCGSRCRWRSGIILLLWSLFC